MVDRYPAQVKAFYFEPDPDGPSVALGVDVLAPEGYGEIIGGGQRIHDLDLLLKRIEEHDLPKEAFDWYLDLRKYRLRAARRIRHGHRTLRRLDVRPRARARNHRLSRACCTGPGHSMRQSHIAIIGAPMDLGAGRRGVDMGPSAIRVAEPRTSAWRRSAIDIEDSGNVAVVQPESRAGRRRARAGICQQIAADLYTAGRHRSRSAAAGGQFPLVLGGDHSVAIGTVSGLSQHYRKQRGKIGLVWIDAHADMNTPETSPSGNIHGMPLVCCIGIGPEELTHIYGYAPKVAPENVAIIGLRVVDRDERSIVHKTGVHAYTMRDIDERGLRAVMQEALEAPTTARRDFIFRSTWMRWTRTKLPASARR